MDDLEIIEKIKKLPPDYLQEVNDFIDFMLEKKINNQTEQKDRSGIFGAFRGKIKMLPGFDDPIEGMEEYM
jgi:hypothetical protein